MDSHDTLPVHRNGYSRGCCFLLFDVTIRESFDGLKLFYPRYITPNSRPAVLVGLNADLESHRQVSVVEALDFAHSNEIRLVEVFSSTIERNINEACDELVRCWGRLVSPNLRLDVGMNIKRAE